MSTHHNLLPVGSWVLPKQRSTGLRRARSASASPCEPSLTPEDPSSLRADVLRKLSRLGRGLLAGGLALALGFTGVPAEAWAQSRPTRSGQQAPVSGKVSVEMMVIYAHNEDRKVDPALRDVMQQLRNFRFTGYELVEQHPSQLSPGQSTSFALPGGRRIRLELLSRDESQAKVRIRMFRSDEKILDTTVSIHRNRSFMIGGPSYRKGKLILPVTVRY